MTKTLKLFFFDSFKARRSKKWTIKNYKEKLFKEICKKLYNKVRHQIKFVDTAAKKKEEEDAKAEQKKISKWKAKDGEAMGLFMSDNVDKKISWCKITNINYV